MYQNPEIAENQEIKTSKMLNMKQKVLAMVDKIPDGRATNFGTIGTMVGANPRTVGYMLTGMSEEEMEKHDWYKVVAKNGYISSLKLGFKGNRQRDILMELGYTIVNDHIDMQKHGYYFEDLARDLEVGGLF